MTQITSTNIELVVHRLVELVVIRKKLSFRTQLDLMSLFGHTHGIAEMILLSSKDYGLIESIADEARFLLPLCSRARAR